ncbi:MAG: glycosyl hydrolase 2 galactose-binding domain-containing protein, partial [Flavobacteriales bacterium]
MLFQLPSRFGWPCAALVWTVLWTLLACTSAFDRPSLELGNWELLLPNDSVWVDAAVPGDVMLDLQRHGILPNPFQGTHERDVQWVELEDWTYRTVLPAPTVWQKQGIQHPVLSFPGLDTYASVYLDDSLVATSNNAYRSCRIPIATASDPCTLKVVLHSPVDRGLEELNALPRVVPVSNEMKPIGSQTSAVTRKPAFQFGWDWAPRLASAGITQAVRIEDFRQPKRADARIEVALRGDSVATVAAQEIGDWPDGTWTLFAPNGSILKASDPATFSVIHPELWWPNGMGEQPLYRLVWEPHEAGFHAVEWQLGIREVTWKREPDAWGHSFECHVNGQRVQARGANVIPGDYFTARALGRDTVLLRQALEANMNMIRVWGGASYPSDGYFDFCDREGILVWQDFMFACMMVAGDSAFFDNVEQEAREQVKR